MMKSASIVSLLFISMVIGCAVGPDFKPPEIEVPSSYRFEHAADEVLVDLKGWDLFNDPTLYSLVTAALENNKNLKIAVSRMEQARAALGVTRADQFPQLNIEAGASIGNFAGGSRSETTNHSLYVAPVVRWEIDFWGKYRRASEAARAELMASRYGLRVLQLSLISEVVATYYLLLDYHQRLAIASETLDSREKSLDIIQQRYDKGIIPEIDLNQAQIQREIAAGAIPLYERLIATTEHALSLLLGRFPGGKGICSSQYSWQRWEGGRNQDQACCDGCHMGLY